MTTNQTTDGVFISRQLAERLTKAWYETEARNELRALLDASEKSDYLQSCETSHNALAVLGAKE